MLPQLLKWMLTFFFAVLCPVAVLSNTATGSFDLRGKVTTRDELGPIARIQHDFRCRFEAKARTWIIEMRASDESGKAGAPNADGYSIVWPDQTLASDGTDFFLRLDTHKIQMTSANDTDSSVKKPINNGIAARGPGVIPFGVIGSELLCLWYSFLSKGYFADRPQGSLHPLSMLNFSRFQETGLEINGHWLLAKGGLPRMIQASNFNGSAGLARLIRSGSKNSTAFSVRFEVLTSRAFGDTEFPSTVRVEFHGYRTESLSERNLIYALDIEVDTIAMLTEPFIVPPAMEGVFTVSDYATWFMERPSESAMIASHSWPDGDDAKEDNKRKLMLAQARQSDERSPVVLVIVILVLLPAVFLSIRLLKSWLRPPPSGDS